jgi:hypothetical protein
MTSQPIRGWAASGVLAGALALSGCGSGDDTTKSATPAGEHLTIDSIPVCTGKTGRYGWRATAKELALTVVDDDACAPRAALFGGTWHRRRAA